LKAKGKPRVGYEFGDDVTLVGLTVFQEILASELAVHIPELGDLPAVDGLTVREMEALLTQFRGFQEVYRRMLGLLQQDPRDHSTAIVELLHDPAFDNLFAPSNAGENDHLFPEPAAEGE
ncbi:MAG: hypothetical protein V1876_04270, partial [Candidatus Peregrinibacteria bacterium]